MARDGGTFEFKGSAGNLVVKVGGSRGGHRVTTGRQNLGAGPVAAEVPGCMKLP